MFTPPIARFLVYLGLGCRCKSKEAAFAESGPVKGTLQLLHVFRSAKRRQTVVLGYTDSDYKGLSSRLDGAGQHHLAFQAKISDRNHCAQRTNSYCRNTYFNTVTSKIWQEEYGYIRNAVRSSSFASQFLAVQKLKSHCPLKFHSSSSVPHQI